MSLYKSVLNKIDQIDQATCSQDRTFGPKQKFAPHYQRFFEGWTSRETVLPNGKIVRKRLYIGPYFVPDLTASARRTRGWLSLLFALLSFACLILAVWQGQNAGKCWYIFAPQTFALIGQLVMLWKSGKKLFQPKRLMMSDYRDIAKGLLLSALILAGLLALTTLCFIGYTLGNGFPRYGLLATLMTLLSAVFAALVFWLEFRTEYKTVPNENAPDPYD